MDAQGEASLLIQLVIPSLVVIGLLSDGSKKDLFCEFSLELLVSSFIGDSETSSLDVFVLDVVDVEVLLALVGVDGVQLEEVLTTNSASKPP